MNANILASRSFSLHAKLFVAAIICALALVLVPAPAHASGLTQPQINAVLGLLSAFNVPQATIDNVRIILNGGSAAETPVATPSVSVSKSSGGEVEGYYSGMPQDVIIRLVNVATGTRIESIGLFGPAGKSNFEIPVSGVPAGTYKLLVMDYANQATVRATSGAFTIGTTGATVSCTLTASPSSITEGQFTQLSWSSTGASYANWKQDGAANVLGLTGSNLMTSGSIVVYANGKGSVSPTLQVTSTGGSTGSCKTTIKVEERENDDEDEDQNDDWDDNDNEDNDSDDDSNNDDDNSGGNNAPVVSSAKPNTAQFVAAAKTDVSTASSMLYGVIGSNTDVRDWGTIMASPDPLATARALTSAMYNSGSKAYLASGATRPQDRSTTVWSYTSGNFTFYKEIIPNVGDNYILALVDANGYQLTSAANPDVLAKHITNFGFNKSDLAGLQAQLTAAGINVQAVTSWPKNFMSGVSSSAASMLAAAAMVPLSVSADSFNILADQVMEINYALAHVLSAYVALFSLEAPQAAAAATASAAPAPVAGESLAATLAYLPGSLYETMTGVTEMLSAVQMAPVHAATDVLSEALYQAGLY